MNTHSAHTVWQNAKKEYALAACLGWFLGNSMPRRVVLTGSWAMALLLRERGEEINREIGDLDLVANSINDISVNVLKHSWLAYREEQYLAFLWRASSPERLKVNIFTDPHPEKDEIVEIKVGNLSIPVVSMEFLVAHEIYDCFQIVNRHVDPKQFDDVDFLLSRCDELTLSRIWNKYYLRKTGYEWRRAWNLAWNLKLSSPNRLVPDATKKRGILKSIWMVIKYGSVTVLSRTFHVTGWNDIW